MVVQTQLFFKMNVLGVNQAYEDIWMAKTPRLLSDKNDCGLKLDANQVLCDVFVLATTLRLVNKLRE